MTAPPVCHLAVVACGNRLSETLVLLKSAVLLTRAKIFFHIFADDDLQPRFKQAVSGDCLIVYRQPQLIYMYSCLLVYLFVLVFPSTESRCFADSEH